MIKRNRNFRKFMISGALLVMVIFVLPYIWPVNAEWYFQNLNWMIPLVIILFIAPLVPFILSGWDIHFFFQPDGNKLTVTITNSGTTPFNFNRVRFASGKKYWIFGKREFYPQKGMSDEEVVYHGADTPSQTLHQHIGCTLSKGTPITVIVRGQEVVEHLKHFEKTKKKVYLCLCYYGTDQRAYSPPIPIELVERITARA